MVEEPLEDLESENIETWQKLQQEKTNESVTCPFCQGSVELVENTRLKCFPSSKLYFVDKIIFPRDFRHEFAS